MNLSKQQRIRKLMTMHKALHPRQDIDGLYVARKEAGRRLASIEYSVDSSIHRLTDYSEKHGGLINAIKNDSEKTVTNRMKINKIQNGKENNSMGTLND